MSNYIKYSFSFCLGNQDFWTHIHSWYHKAWWEEKRKGFQGNLLNYLTSRLTKRHGQTVHLQRPVVITVYKWTFSFFREVKISFSENGRWSLFLHPSQRALFFLAPFALLLHKYTHMFVCEMGNPLLCELLAVCFCFLSHFSMLCLFHWTSLPTCALWRSHQGIWERNAWPR